MTTKENGCQCKLCQAVRKLGEKVGAEIMKSIPHTISDAVTAVLDDVERLTKDASLDEQEQREVVSIALDVITTTLLSHAAHASIKNGGRLPNFVRDACASYEHSLSTHVLSSIIEPLEEQAVHHAARTNSEGN